MATPVLTYSDLLIQAWDLDFIHRMEYFLKVSIDDVELSDFITVAIKEEHFSISITNYIISEMMYLGAENIENDQDRELIRSSIYTNCFDSFYNVDLSKLESEQAKKFVEDFNAL